MSEQDNTALVQSAYAAFGRGDIAAVLETMTDDVEWITPKTEGVPTGGTAHGKAEVAGFFQTLDRHEEIFEFEPQEFIAQGDKVVAVGRLKSRVRATGRVAESPWIHVFTFRGGKVARFFEVYDTAAALRAHSAAAGA